MNKIATVVLDTNIDKPLDYLIPEELLTTILPGMRVNVPVKNTIRKGFILELKQKSSFKKLKPLHQVLSTEVLSKDLLQLAIWMAKYYCSSLSKVLRCIVPTSVREEIKPKKMIFLSLLKTKKETASISAELKRSYPSQSKILDLLLKAKKGLFLQDILTQTKVSTSPIQTLIRKKIIKEERVLSDFSSLLDEDDFFRTQAKALNDEQKSSYESICKSINNASFDTHLIYGITGSGKTEIYLQAIQHALDNKKSVIMLVPEVALTSQTIERFRHRFSNRIAVIHHKRSQGERFEAWQDIKNNNAQIVIGARSAIFSPVVNLGLIILDEEHDPSYKQEDESPCYHSKHIAMMRCKQNNCPLVLGSATPSIESYWQANQQKFYLHTLTKRATNASLSSVSIIDMRQELQKQNQFSHFSSTLLSAIKERYEKGEQALLFLNRRGYYSFLFCSDCSHVITCPHCDISLTYHKKENILLCHGCYFSMKTPNNCPNCSSSSTMQYKGFGTEHVERSLKAIFPEIRTLRLDRDTTQSKHSHEQLFKQFRCGKADVLIGTQMIVKGLHFPSVTLVGILNSDSAINIPDFRSSEFVFQLLTQVSGRAGRCFLPGEVLIQTFLPHNPTIQLSAKQDFISFYNQEIETREAFSYPPFTKMVKFLFSGYDENKTKIEAQNFRQLLINSLTSDCQIHPVIPCGRAKLKDKFRFFFLIRYKNTKATLIKIKEIKDSITLPSSVNLLINVDPIHTF